MCDRRSWRRISWPDLTRKGKAELRIPPTLIGNFQGAAQAFQSSLTGMGLLLIMSIFVIYLILGILYESYIHPITILSGLPTAGLGALLTLMLRPHQGAP